MDDASHLGKFNHNYLVDLQPGASELSNLRPQDIDYLLVLDLEGKVEILEFPVVMIETKTMDVIDSFHRCNVLQMSVHLYILCINHNVIYSCMIL